MLNATRVAALPTMITGYGGFGRDALARRITSYKCVVIALGARIVRPELGLPEAPVPATDLRFT